MTKSILITGGGSGIGQNLAWLCSENDFRVYIVGRHRKKLLNTKQKYPKNIECIDLDITITDSQALITNVIREQKLDYIVHNAGLITPVVDLMNISNQDLKAIINTNLLAPIILTKTLKPLLNHSRILNISSGLAHKAVRGAGAYSISKAGLYMTKEVFNTEVSSDLAIFGSVMPGVVKTNMSQSLMSDDFGNAELFNKLKASRKLITPEIAARFLFFILTETKADAFIDSEWDIYDPSHYSKWLGEDEIFCPF